MGLYAVQRGVCPGCGFHQPHHLRFEVDHIVALSNLQLLCSYCNRTKATRGSQGLRMKMVELRVHNTATGMMVDEQLAERTGRRLARYHRIVQVEGSGRSV